MVIYLLIAALLGINLSPSSAFTVPILSETRWRRMIVFAQQDDEEPDLFEYFDPLLSPHAYPNGVSPDAKPVDPIRKAEPLPMKTTEDPLRLKHLNTIKESVQTFKDDRPPVDTSRTFDPTLSPHAYVNGTPDVVIGDEDAVYLAVGSGKSVSKVVGIVLMDHGSKNEASNRRLHTMAQLYQDTLEVSSTTSVLVRAAHMEIAEPSIPVVLAELIEKGVDEIVCHPYFLSPAGRHASEDIPRIIEQAMEDMKVDIPVVTTPPVGADLQLMLGAVHSLVQESSTLLKGK